MSPKLAIHDCSNGYNTWLGYNNIVDGQFFLQIFNEQSNAINADGVFRFDSNIRVAIDFNHIYCIPTYALQAVCYAQFVSDVRNYFLDFYLNLNLHFHLLSETIS